QVLTRRAPEVDKLRPHEGYVVPDGPRDVLDAVALGPLVELGCRPPHERVVDVKGEVVVELAGHLGRTEKLLGISQLRNQPRWRALPAAVVVAVKLCQKITGVPPDEAGDPVEVHRTVAQVDEGYPEEPQVVARRKARLNGIVDVELADVEYALPVRGEIRRRVLDESRYENARHPVDNDSDH